MYQPLYTCYLCANNFAMRFDNPVPLTEIAALINAELIGNTTASASGINEIHKVERGDLVFVDHPKYYDICINSAASFIIINKKVSFPKRKPCLLHLILLKLIKPL